MCVEEYIPLRIAELCRKRGYTKYRLAQLTGITQTALGNMLNQKSMPTMANLEKICDAFEITIAQFFSDDESRLDLTRHWGCTRRASGDDSRGAFVGEHTIWQG